MTCAVGSLGPKSHEHTALEDTADHPQFSDFLNRNNVQKVASEALQAQNEAGACKKRKLDDPSIAPPKRAKTEDAPSAQNSSWLMDKKEELKTLFAEWRQEYVGHVPDWMLRLVGIDLKQVQDTFFDGVNDAWNKQQLIDNLSKLKQELGGYREDYEVAIDAINDAENRIDAQMQLLGALS